MKDAARLVVAILLTAGALTACASKPPAKRYVLHGQIIAVDDSRKELTIKHGDIPGLMPGMTMSYGVSSAALMAGRTPGELITGTLEVDDATGRLVEIVHTGTAPLPSDSNEIALAAGVLDVGDPAPDAALIDQNNRRRAFSEWHGVVTVLTFVYTHCPLPNFCPLMNQNFATLQRRLADDTALRGHVKLVTVTFDPEHDTPAVLADLARTLKADPAVWTMLTGDAVTVERFAAKFGVSVIHDTKDETALTHNLRTIVIGADGRVAKIYSGSNWTPGDVLTDLRGLVAAPR
jgi:protein SCO1/2